ncbi:SGNH hydrolase-type esterase domain-containing protein [Crucibulum laeve]|uniref:SGNH hydrolase-type esterase domain-containing protein n=1 Tax=Crucibulum laeve TaxID=68775 RepID=A0A5C3LJY9_9AGAR|nr:SGNH hydrolase-type esterase domain-containing protein [Crucibulum laeve]
MKVTKLISTLSTLLVAIYQCSAAPPPNSSLNVLRERQAGTQWVSIWTSMPQLVEQSNLPPSPFNGGSVMFNDATLRQTFFITEDAPRIRIQFSNTFGGSVLSITAASLALPQGGAAGVGQIQTSTLHALTFNGGSPSVTIPTGQVVYTDPIDFPVTAQTNIAVSIYLKSGQSGSNITGHPGSRTTSWMQSGNQVNSTNVSGGSTAHWYFATGVEGFINTDTKGLIILGDSITDGRGSDDNKNNRWPDLVLARMRKSGITNIAVGNQAAGGNRVLQDGLGPSLISRYKRDAINQAGVKYVMVFEGVNDIGTANSDAASQQQVGDQLIAAFQQIVSDAKAAGLKIFAATITPLGSGYTAGSREPTRQRINQWILTSGTYDAVVDFDKIVRNPSNPSQLAQQYDSGDGLHPNVAGYQAIANQFPLDVLTGSAPHSTTSSSPTSTTSSAPPVTTTTSTPPATTSPTAQAAHYAQCGTYRY